MWFTSVQRLRGDKPLLEAFSTLSLNVHFLNKSDQQEALSLFIDKETEVRTVLVITEGHTASRPWRESPAQSSDPIYPPLLLHHCFGGSRRIS